MSEETKKSIFNTMSTRISQSKVIQKPKSFLLWFLGLFDKPLEKIMWNIIILALFSALYHLFARVKDASGNQRRLTLGEAIYFTFTVHFTVGFGDFVPSNREGKGIYMAHVALVWVVNMVPSGLLDALETTDSVATEYIAGNQVAPLPTPTETPSNVLNRALSQNLIKNAIRRKSLAS